MSAYDTKIVFKKMNLGNESAISNKEWNQNLQKTKNILLVSQIVFFQIIIFYFLFHKSGGCTSGWSPIWRLFQFCSFSSIFPIFKLFSFYLFYLFLPSVVLEGERWEFRVTSDRVPKYDFSNFIFIYFCQKCFSHSQNKTKQI